MKLFLALLVLAVPGAYGQSVEIVSPNKAYTFAYGDAISHQIERNHFTNQMIARVTFSNYPYAGYKLGPNAQIFLVKRSGHVTAVLNATTQPQGGERWVQVDDNWSLQNLLALGFDRLTR